MIKQAMTSQKCGIPTEDRTLDLTHRPGTGHQLSLELLLLLIADSDPGFKWSVGRVRMVFHLFSATG